MSFDVINHAALPLLLDVAAKGTVVLVLAFLLAKVLQRASAGTRHLLWASTVGVLLMLPLMALFLPAWQCTLGMPGLELIESLESVAVPVVAVPTVAQDYSRQLPPTTETAQAHYVAPDSRLVASRAATLPGSVLVDDAPPVASAHVPVVDMASWIGRVWLAGIGLSLLWLAGGLIGVLRLGRRCRLAQRGALAGALCQVAANLGIRRPIRLLLSPDRDIPMTWGIYRPVVLLPEEAQTWPSSRLNMVLIHELGHVQRWDCLVQMLAHLMRGVYWWHPLAWLAVRQLRVEQEQACDDLVLHSGASAVDYAEHLMAVTASVSRCRWTAPVALGIGRASRLRQRLIHLLDPRRHHRPVERRGLLLTAAAALAVALPLGMVAYEPRAAEVTAAQTKDEAKQPPVDKDDALLKKIGEVQQQLVKHYVAPVNEKMLTESAINGLLSGLKDPYTTYIPADELKQFDTQVQGALTGIGVQIQAADQRLTVASPLEGSPAHKAGLRPGDFIESIDGKSTHGMSLPAAVQLILGKPGTVVKLKVVHPEGAVAELAITRAEIQVPSISGFFRGPDGRWQFLLDGDNKVGYIQILQFSSRTAADVRQAAEELQKHGVKGLILDLRSCPGGLLEQAIEVCKLFLSKGVIVTTRAPGKAERSFQADGKAPFADWPMLVLVNDQTASAGEIVAGALRDNNRAILLGSRTFGKGSVSSVMKLDGGGALKVTTAYHYLPSGRNIQKRPGEKIWGVDPSDGFYIPLTATQTEAMLKDAKKRALVGLAKDEQPPIPARLTPKMIEEQYADPQLAAALRSMVAKITGGEFIKVGMENALQNEHATRLEELRQRREQLQQSMSKLDKEITDLQKK
jgi:carboxyl-terminal processing protease